MSGRLTPSTTTQCRSSRGRYSRPIALPGGGGTRASRRYQRGLVELVVQRVLVVVDRGGLAVDLVGREEQDDQAQRDEQLAGDPEGAAEDGTDHQSGACAYCSEVEPSYAGTVASASGLTWYPRPSVAAASRKLRTPSDWPSAADSASGLPIAVITNGGEYTRPLSSRVFPTHRTALVEITRTPMMDIASAPPAHSALTTAWTSCWCTTRSSGLTFGGRLAS